MVWEMQNQPPFRAYLFPDEHPDGAWHLVGRETELLLNSLHCTGQSLTTKNSLIQYANNVKTKKSCSRSSTFCGSYIIPTEEEKLGPTWPALNLMTTWWVNIKPHVLWKKDKGVTCWECGWEKGHIQTWPAQGGPHGGLYKFRGQQ